MSGSHCIDRITILGTGLIGASIGLALREHNFGGEIFGWDKNPSELAIALSRGAIDTAVEDPITAATGSKHLLHVAPVHTGVDKGARCGVGAHEGQA